MGANYREKTGKAPRQNYKERKLISESFSLDKIKAAHGIPLKPDNDNIKDESLPRGWNILEPNRIKERRIAAGYDTTDKLSLKINSISYLRLSRLENGLLVGRESEYELIAQALEIPVASLKLPMLMRSETIQWMDLWGAKKTSGEGGDHDSVLLAAYLRYQAESKNTNPHAICSKLGLRSSTLSFMWHAEKTVDRYSDSAMYAAMALTEQDTWDDVVRESQLSYARGEISDYVRWVQKPRVRYAPEDPDKRAPWTYDIDPFRTAKKREKFENSYSRPKSLKGRINFKNHVEKLKDKRSDIHKRIKYYRDMKMIVDIVRKTESPAQMLLEKYPNHKKKEDFLQSKDYARRVLLRILCIKYLRLNDDLYVKPVAPILGMTSERVRQLKKLEESQVNQLTPYYNDHPFYLVEPKWEDYKNISIQRSKNETGPNYKI
jgi:hypothetical protein